MISLFDGLGQTLPAKRPTLVGGIRVRICKGTQEDKMIHEPNGLFRTVLNCKTTGAHQRYDPSQEMGTLQGDRAADLRCERDLAGRVGLRRTEGLTVGRAPGLSDHTCVGGACSAHFCTQSIHYH